MKFLRYIDYFLQLRLALGFKATCSFALLYLGNKINPPRGGKLAHILVGPYVFYFPSLPHFEGLFSEIFLQESYFVACTKEPIRVIDCGTNIGVALLYVKIRAPHAIVTCFEPNPAARAVLEKNIEANNWKKEVQVFPYALGKEKGTVEFFVTDTVATSSDGGVVDYLKKKGRVLNSYTVEADTLSHYIDDTVDLLKIDIEGPEFAVIEELIVQNKMRHITQIQLEYHYIPEFFSRTLSEMLALLEKEGFQTFVQANAPAHAVINRDTTHTYMIFAWR